MDNIESSINPAWRHPYLFKCYKENPLTEKELVSYAYDYYLRFLPFFRNQPEGSIHPGTVIKFTGRMKKKLGLADMMTHEIRLNRSYFRSDPKLLPYTLFHEMVHLWLFDCMYDPGHTKRFYNKMKHFEKTGLPIDRNVHIHQRLATEGNHIYVCTGCDSRWFFTKKLKRPFVCAHCYEKTGSEIFPAYYSHRGAFQAIMTDGTSK